MAKETFFVWTMSNGEKCGEHLEIDIDRHQDALLEVERRVLIANLDNCPDEDLILIKSEMKALLDAMDIHVE
jgi:hypothetical protein